MNSSLRITANKSQKGFTLMEIVVATTIFAIVGTAMTSLFNYTLRINRRTEALRQASQGVRTFVESFVKQVRNGQIYYGIISGTDTADSALGPCLAGSVSGGGERSQYYAEKENKIRVISTDGEDVCFYLANASNGNVSYVTPGVFSGNSLAVEKKNSGANLKEIVNPENVRVENFALFIRPVCDPYGPCSDEYGSGYPKIQPMAHMAMKLVASLPTGENVTIYYQTAVSNNQYDIPTE